MKTTTFGLTVLGLALLSTSAAHAQAQQNTTRTYTNVDAFGNVTSTTVEAPTSIAAELAQQALYGALPPNGASIGVNSGYYSGYPAYPSYPYPAYPTYGYGQTGYPYAAYPAYPYPYPNQQLPVSGPIGVPGYSGPSYTSIPLGNSYYYGGNGAYCPPGYGYGNYGGYGSYTGIGIYGGLGGGFTGSYTSQSQNVGVGVNVTTGKAPVQGAFGAYRSSSGITSITRPIGK